MYCSSRNRDYKSGPHVSLTAAEICQTTVLPSDRRSCSMEAHGQGWVSVPGTRGTKRGKERDGHGKHFQARVVQAKGEHRIIDGI